MGPDEAGTIQSMKVPRPNWNPMQVAADGRIVSSALDPQDLLEQLHSQEK
jgi:hypothetical protein